jgi:hypothetical protein
MRTVFGGRGDSQRGELLHGLGATDGYQIKRAGAFEACADPLP